jgi:lysophospholipase L1-like esterase
MSRAWLGISAALACTASLVLSSSAAAGETVPLRGSVAGAGAAVPLPDSMAAAGDSISQAFDVKVTGIFQDNPTYSWSTGTNKSVDSEYDRILAANPAIKGHEYNDSVAGDMMSNLDGQLQTAAGQGVQYVTIEIGADDLCVNSVAQMTPTATFQSEFQQALTDFTAADPTASIFVASIPNIYQVWKLNHNNPLAELVWNTLPFCNTMLPSSVTSAERQQVVQQEQAYNQVLGSVCAGFSQCLFDNDAVYDFKFTKADTSPVDFFHPSIAGQRLLASIAWAAGFWSADAKTRQPKTTVRLPARITRSSA